MAFPKTLLAFLLLALVAATTHARVDFLGLFDNSPCPPPGPTKCLSCECDEEAGKCYRSDTRQGKCPSNCSGGCACDRSLCPRCWCSYEVKGCPKLCPTTTTTAQAKFENLLSLKTD
ncbi:hypothetical protein F8388_011221 [Cannabis sativa]|uniref:Bowman-Birk serine protease inhibitors family domain-containing protein n=1 Tax=Cannabis sativa TaxID=3483 RepID=A0A7J6FA81_CANSA|nr:hypothetical protein F8388_011221 [Cannabis sativa]KAF4376126.1 hypothetical protein G4B88_025217 [Cannabis sativa]